MTGGSFDTPSVVRYNPGVPALPLTVFYSPAYVVEGRMETVTKARLVAERLEAGAAGAVVLRAPCPADRRELATVHTAEHIRSTFEDEGAFLEVGPWSRPLLDSILASTGGMRDAVGVALREGRAGSLSSGLHHARRGSGYGYCQFNGLALAAVEALKHVRTVGILDLDAHGGGGTFDILGADPRVVLADVSVHDFDSWEPQDPSRHHYAHVTRPARYLDAVDVALDFLRPVDLLIYNAGMDVYEKAGGLKGLGRDIVVERERRVVAWARARGIPHLFALAGGYKWGGLTLAQVADLHVETVKAFAAP